MNFKNKLTDKSSLFFQSAKQKPNVGAAEGEIAFLMRNLPFSLRKYRLCLLSLSLNLAPARPRSKGIYAE